MTSESVSQRGRTTATLAAGIVPLGNEHDLPIPVCRKDAEFQCEWLRQRDERRVHAG